MKRIFVSSVQKEFERERSAIKRMIEADPILKPHFKAFVFEIDAPAADKTTQQVYLKEIEKSDIYLVLIGNKYGYCSEGEVSPTEQEFDRAKELGLTTLVMVLGRDESYAPNPRIARAMYQVKYIETLGTGLTDLLAECKAKGLKKPLFEEVSGRFRVVIWRPKTTNNRGGNGGANRGANRGANLLNALPVEQRKICNKLLGDPHLSSRALAKELGIRRNTVLKQLESLKAKGILVRKGGTRGFWEIIGT